MPRATETVSKLSRLMFGIIVIGLIGLIGLASDLLFKRVNRGLFPWTQLR